MSPITSLSAIDPLTREDLHELAQVGDGTRASVYMTTHTSGPETLQGPVQLRNLLDRAAELGADDELLAPMRELLDDGDFWQHQSEGLALFAAPGFFRRYRLPVEVSEQVDVSNSFRVRPLVPLISDNDTFRIIALSQHAVRLFEADRYRIEELDLDGVPTSVDEALAYDDDFPRMHRAAGGGHSFHGHGGEEEGDKAEIERFFRAVDHALHEKYGVTGTPLVLASVAHHQPVFASVSTAHTHVLDEVVEGNPERTSPQDLHAAAWEIANRFLANDGRRAAWQRFQDASGTGLTATDLSTVVLSAAVGRVDTVFVAPGPPILGTYDVDTSTVRVAGTDAPGEAHRVDLVDEAVLQTLAHGGSFMSVDTTDLPDGSDVGALLRY
jgi:hypothetical protein